MPTQFTSQRITRTATITLQAPPDRVFPLFGPVREAEWAAGWAPRIVYAETELAEEEGAVFITRHDGQVETIWIVVRYDSLAFLVEYARITPGATAVRVIVQCASAPGGTTSAQVTYQVTTLSEGPHDLVTTHYPDMLAGWQTAINHALTTGHPPHPHH